jgi:hypothetical protein
VRGRFPVIVAVALATVLAASVVTAGAQSGGGDTTTTAPKTTTPSQGNRGVTATSIKVGGLGYSYLYGDADIGAKARFQRANDTGGVNGRRLRRSHRRRW